MVSNGIKIYWNDSGYKINNLLKWLNMGFLIYLLLDNQIYRINIFDIFGYSLMNL